MNSPTTTERGASPQAAGSKIKLGCLLLLLSLGNSCQKTASPPAQSAPQASSIKVETKSGGPIVFTTSTAEFQVLPSGGVRAFLLKNGGKATLDAQSSGASYLALAGKNIRFGQVRTRQARRCSSPFIRISRPPSNAACGGLR